jgi:hypothetical protein
VTRLALAAALAYLAFVSAMLAVAHLRGALFSP